jgi:hypothetical protein
MTIKTFIRHRVNTIAELSALDPALGVELDLRNALNRIILNHEVFEDGDDFKEYLKTYRHNTLILNTKTDGLEDALIALMEEHGIDNYFFLDTTIPTTVKYARKGFKKIAVRFSEYEPLSFVEQYEGKTEWVWVDCFTRNILGQQAYAYLKQHFKICIVSPELQAHPLEWIADFKHAFADFELDAVCTKRPDLWK